MREGSQQKNRVFNLSEKRKRENSHPKGGLRSGGKSLREPEINIYGILPKKKGQNSPFSFRMREGKDLKEEKRISYLFFLVKSRGKKKNRMARHPKVFNC